MDTEVSSNTNDSIALVPVSRDQMLPVTTGQARLWYLSQVQEPAYTYNEQIEVRINGSLDITFLKRSFATIIERHEILRTVFTQTSEGELQQIILAPFSIDIPTIFTGKYGMSKTELEQEIGRVSLEQGQILYDLATGPLFRVCILQLPKNKQIFLFSGHHIMLDSRSLEILLKEINILYTAESQNIPSVFDELPIQWADYACWEQQWVNTEIVEHRLDYWREQLQGLPPLLELPVDHSRPTQEKFYGAWEFVDFPKKLTEKLLSVSWQERVPPYIVVLAVYKVLLMRYAGQTDIAVGSIIANRPNPNIKDLLGFLAETVILRSNLSAGTTFKQLLRELNTLSNDAFYKKFVPFSKLIEVLRSDGTLLSDASPIQAALVFDGMSSDEKMLAGQKIISSSDRPMGTSKFDISLSLKIENGNLKGFIEYNKDLFDSSTIKRFFQHYRLLLESVVENIDQTIESVPFLSKEESKQILVDWNATTASYPKNQCIHKLFEAQVENNPDSIAVVFYDKEMTYRELNERSNRLANYLINKGVGPEIKVGLYLERSLEMIIGILGILKAGGAYVPIDPDYPQQRTAYILEDSCVDIVLTQVLFSDQLAKFDFLYLVVCLDNHSSAIEQHSVLNSSIMVDFSNLAYVIYTSGSTGRPKGVMVNHENILNTLNFLESNYPVKENNAYLLKTNYVFDVSLSELFGWFMGRGHLVILPAGAEKDLSTLIRCIAAYKITHINFVPSMLSVFMQEARRNQEFIENCSLKYLMVAGEAFPKPLVRESVDLFKNASVENIYGPTEASIYSAWFSCSSSDITSANTPIGKPLTNTQLYILDDFFNPVPIGVSGELYIAGMGLARGYLNQKDLTTATFIDNPFNPNTKLYKTSDSARWLQDGNIEYLGRTDYQVKIRGYRVELGEVESVLSALPEVREAVVLAHDHGGETGGEYLSAYVVLDDEVEIGSVQIKNKIKEILPDYMVPSFFLLLKTFPLTSNGKVDRKAFPKPDAESLEMQEYMPPSTEVEKGLVNIWSDILNISSEKIGIYDSFFDMGGHSLLATRVIIHVAEIFNIEIKIRDLLMTRSLKSLALLIKEKINDQQLTKDLTNKTFPSNDMSREEIRL